MCVCVCVGVESDRPVTGSDVASTKLRSCPLQPLELHKSEAGCASVMAQEKERAVH